ncbi:hypothetical protein KR215_010492, partial [Drosophila sulfurigaster]
KDDWRSGATNMPIMSPSPYLLSRFTTNVPLPTLYAGDAARKPKLSVIELLLYNMASLLAGVAAGYDVRMSNVSPVHPTLLSELPALKAAPKAPCLELQEQEQQQSLLESQSQALTRQEEHDEQQVDGTTRQLNQISNAPRYAPLSDALMTASSQKPQNLAQRRVGGSQPYYTPVQRTPQHQLHQQQTQPQSQQQQQQQQQLVTATVAGQVGAAAVMAPQTVAALYAGSQPPTPSPRRKLSSSSCNNPTTTTTGGGGGGNDGVFEEFRVGGGIGPPPLYAPADYLRNGPSYSNDGGGGGYRNGYFGSNYFPYRPELNFTYERDCKSYPDYSYDYNHRLPDYYDYHHHHHHQQQQQQYEAASAAVVVPLQTRTPPPRVPQMGVTAGGHRRTPSTVSNNSNVLLEHEELMYDYNNLNLNVQLNVDYDGSGGGGGDTTSLPPPTVATAATLSKQDLYAIGSPKLINRMLHSPLAKSKYAPVTRPASLPFEQHALSYQQQQQQQLPPQQQQQQQQPQQQQLQLQPGKLRSSMKKYNSNGGSSISSQQGTPTNPTPPDSLTSDDSSYLSAKEGSIGSQHSRVRFSPEAYLDANLPLLPRRMTTTSPSSSSSNPAIQQQQQQHQHQRHHRHHGSSASTPSPSASS